MLIFYNILSKRTGNVLFQAKCGDRLQIHYCSGCSVFRKTFAAVGSIWQSVSMCAPTDQRGQVVSIHAGIGTMCILPWYLFNNSCQITYLFYLVQNLWYLPYYRGNKERFRLFVVTKQCLHIQKHYFHNSVAPSKGRVSWPYLLLSCQPKWDFFLTCQSPYTCINQWHIS